MSRSAAGVYVAAPKRVGSRAMFASSRASEPATPAGRSLAAGRLLVCATVLLGVWAAMAQPSQADGLTPAAPRLALHGAARSRPQARLAVRRALHAAARSRPQARLAVRRDGHAASRLRPPGPLAAARRGGHPPVVPSRRHGAPGRRHTSSSHGHAAPVRHKRRPGGQPPSRPRVHAHRKPSPAAPPHGAPATSSPATPPSSGHTTAPPSGGSQSPQQSAGAHVPAAPAGAPTSGAHPRTSSTSASSTSGASSAGHGGATSSAGRGGATARPIAHAQARGGTSARTSSPRAPSAGPARPAHGAHGAGASRPGAGARKRLSSEAKPNGSSGSDAPAQPTKALADRRPSSQAPLGLRIPSLARSSVPTIIAILAAALLITLLFLDGLGHGPRHQAWRERWSRRRSS
jgi:hypothetical protein